MVCNCNTAVNTVSPRMQHQIQIQIQILGTYDVCRLNLTYCILVYSIILLSVAVVHVDPHTTLQHLPASAVVWRDDAVVGSRSLARPTGRLVRVALLYTAVSQPHTKTLNTCPRMLLPCDATTLVRVWDRRNLPDVKNTADSWVARCRSRSKCRSRHTHLSPLSVGSYCLLYAGFCSLFSTLVSYLKFRI